MNQKVCYFFSHKIKDTFFTFNNHFADLGVLSMSALSRCWLPARGGQGAAQQLPMHATAPSRELFGVMSIVRETLPTTFDTFNQSQHLFLTLHKSCFAFQMHFDLS